MTVFIPIFPSLRFKFNSDLKLNWSMKRVFFFLLKNNLMAKEKKLFFSFNERLNDSDSTKYKFKKKQLFIQSYFCRSAVSVGLDEP